MVERRRPLVLLSTKILVDSVLNSAKSAGISDAGDGLEASKVPYDHTPSSLRLKAGILKSSGDCAGSDGLEKGSSLIGVSVLVLKKLQVTAGSPVLVRNFRTKVGRIVKILALDPPDRAAPECTEAAECIENTGLSFISHVGMNVLPSVSYSSSKSLSLEQGVAYITPLLAFNLGLHISCLDVLIHQDEKNLGSFFEVKEVEKKQISCDLHVELFPWPYLPRYASHLRISFLRVPECGLLGSFKESSKIEADDRQDKIDSALNEYFKVDRFLARGDVFFVHIDWHCGSEMCTACDEKGRRSISSNMIYFKVMEMDPLNEPILRVNCNRTALVLGGSATSAVPSEEIVLNPRGITPLQGNTIKHLASIIAPRLCPSFLQSKFKLDICLHGPTGCGKRTVVKYIAHRLGLHVVEFSCHDLVTSSKEKASTTLANAFKTACRYSPSILLLRHIDVFGNLSSNDGSPSDHMTFEIESIIRELTEPTSDEEDLCAVQTSNNGLLMVEPEQVRKSQVLLVAAADSVDGLPNPIWRSFSHKISMGSLSEEQRIDMLDQFFHDASNILDQNINDDFKKEITGQTSGFTPRDVRALIADASSSFVHRILNDAQRVAPRLNEDEKGATGFRCEDTSSRYISQMMGKDDFRNALERSKKRNASALGTPKVPNVKWEDVGGLEEVKKSILDTVQLPFLHKHLFSSGVRKRSAILLYGPPGTGKTLLAKAVATECSLNFLSVKGPELINMYIGESEKNVRDIFQKAREACPCVIFFDELDALAPARGASGDSGGVMDRVVSQMLGEMDGLSGSSEGVFILGASNRPDILDPALLRPGRFDKLLYVGVNSDASYRERVLVALTRKFKLHENVSLLSLAKKCPPNFTGADMYGLCAGAWYHAFVKCGVSSDPSNTSSDGAQAASVIVEMDDFIKALGEVSPSLPMTELKFYERLREQFGGLQNK